MHEVQRKVEPLAPVRELLARHREVVRARPDPDALTVGFARRFATYKRAGMIFTDMDRLEQLLWPRVGEAIARWRAELDATDTPPRAAVVEVPLLFESGMQDIFDATIAVIADEQVRERRVATRAHASLEERLARQLPQKEKAGLATYVVVNDGTVAELEAELSAVLEKLQPVSAR